MIKAALVLGLSVSIASAWFAPRLGLGHDDSNNIDTSYVRDSKKDIVTDTKSSKMYHDATSSQKMNFPSANKYCQDMAYLDYKNWRVPSKKELRSVLELSRRGVTIKHAFKNIKEDIFWSSTEDDYKKAWYFDLDLGRYGSRKQTKEFYVFCVRDAK
ncbi:MAG: DUF1566 domain-containing protein [Campylobacterota bacterium]|nr:DUF1566 domain-containing protein [Campylobacterota bacterium]